MSPRYLPRYPGRFLGSTTLGWVAWLRHLIYIDLPKYQRTHTSGDLTGGCVLNFMIYNADEIMAEVALLLANKKSKECKLTEQHNWDLCINVSAILLCLDGVLLMLHQEDPEEKVVALI